MNRKKHSIARDHSQSTVASAAALTALRRATFVLALVASPSLLPAQSSTFDVVQTVSGTRVRGLVVEMSPEHVGVDSDGTVRKVGVLEIRSLTFSDEPAPLRDARNSIRQGQLEAALGDLDKINAAEVRRDVVKQDVEFYRAYCQSRLALTSGKDLGSAATQMLNFVRDNRNSYHFLEGVETLGDLAMALGRPSSAVRYYAELKRASSYKTRGTLLEAGALQATGNFAEALTGFDDVITTGDAEPRQMALAVIGKAACQAHLGKPEDAIAAIEDQIVKNDPQDVDLFAQAYNALGDAYRQAKKPKDAILAYLHVDILFYRNAEAHAEALYNLSNLWDEISKPDRGVEARKLLQTRYPGSRWAKL